jgi:HlyD family secretion protein
MRRTLLIGLLVVAAGAAGVWWWLTHHERALQELILYGNVDLRQVQLAFYNSERIAAVLAQEGDRVKKGQVVARLDTGRLEPQVAPAEAQVASQRHIVERLHHGSRPEEIAQTRANVASAKADAANARRQYERAKNLSVVRLETNPKCVR